MDTGYGFVHFTDDDEGIATSFRALNAISAISVIDGVEYSCEASQNLLRSIHELKKRQLANQHQPLTAQLAAAEPMMQSSRPPHYSSIAHYSDPGNRGNNLGQYETSGQHNYNAGLANYQIRQLGGGDRPSYGNRDARGWNGRSYSSTQQNYTEYDAPRYSSEFEQTSRTGLAPTLPPGERISQQYSHSPRSQVGEFRSYQASPRADMPQNHSLSGPHTSSNFSLAPLTGNSSFPAETRAGNVVEVRAAEEGFSSLNKCFYSHPTETKELSGFSMSHSKQEIDHLANSSNKSHLSANAETYELDSKFHVTEHSDRSYRIESDVAQAEEFPYTFPTAAPGNNPLMANSHDAEPVSTSTVIMSGAISNTRGSSIHRSNRKMLDNSSRVYHSNENGKHTPQLRPGGRDYSSSSQGRFSGIHDSILHWQPSKDRKMHSGSLTPGTTLVSTYDELSDSDSLLPYSFEEKYQSLAAYNKSTNNFRAENGDNNQKN